MVLLVFNVIPVRYRAELKLKKPSLVALGLPFVVEAVVARAAGFPSWPQSETNSAWELSSVIAV